MAKGRRSDINTAILLVQFDLDVNPSSLTFDLKLFIVEIFLDVNCFPLSSSLYCIELE
jgi:hypothetical protein